MIGDGMGPQQIKAGELYRGEKLTMQKFPYMTKVETRSASDAITDSAAAATALATGVRTNNGVIGKNPLGENLETIVDIAKKLGKRTGVLATEELNGATPMGFSSHADARGMTKELLETAVESSNVDLFASYLVDTKYNSTFKKAGYKKLDIVDDISETKAEKVFGSYIIPADFDSMQTEGAYTAFDRLVTEALEFLSKDEDGFFLMTEGAHIDHGGHNNDFEYMLSELLAFDMAVEAVLEWAKDRDDTVVIVTADHETGGLELSENITKENMYDSQSYLWTTSGHTATDVWCYINGANIDFSKYTFGNKERIANTDIFQIMKSLMQG
jgi:alkaline phosphatase